MSEPIEVVSRGRFLSFVKRRGWEYVDRPGITGIVAIVPITEDGCLILLDQYREPVGGNVIEIPAGLVGDDEGHEKEGLAEAARRELEEETGYRAATLEFLTIGPPSAGLSSEIVTFFLATGLARVGSGGGVGNERIAVHRVPIDNAHAWLDDQANDGKLIDPKVYLALYFANCPKG